MTAPKGFKTNQPPGSFAPASLPSRKRESSGAISLRRKQKWRKLSERIRIESPWCCDPFGNHQRRGIKKPSQSVHHIVAVEVAPALAHSRQNLAAICNACHNSLEVEERSGNSTLHFFGVQHGPGGGEFIFPPPSATHTRNGKKSGEDFRGKAPIAEHELNTNNQVG